MTACSQDGGRAQRLRGQRSEHKTTQVDDVRGKTAHTDTGSVAFARLEDGAEEAGWGACAHAETCPRRPPPAPAHKGCVPRHLPRTSPARHVRLLARRRVPARALRRRVHHVALAPAAEGASVRALPPSSSTAPARLARGGCCTTRRPERRILSVVQHCARDDSDTG
ncbi:uncharacterized protein TRAVEDRAFT_74519 [Trametes versicolor FP-101664 SS1]|uniref:uncharacterized protein n=1 Tax=Trametes versicolor (strain FP-101664) TaxID=717944 RepID=UPI0004623C07|nr:uncharacterized protein TRAVEDRAFT_74519 [Trametes versicolor FP-101664 SS1]EIW54470.1 hypothetical protein TRAVEDRAFT_74519 [Trametes versicolor FP-101664 SS1]